ncbi:MAG: hypothetical protein AAFP84_17040 [Actinomycetota bacterium]
MTNSPNGSDAVRVPAHAAEQFAYHLRLSVAAAVGSDATSAACEPLLAWAVLAAAVPELDELASRAEAELVTAATAIGTPDRRNTVATAATQRALELEAHYASVGNHDVAELYARVADDIGATLDRAFAG